MEKPEVVILCGGKGSRLGEETTLKPRPMVEIGNKPMLWHIMKIYAHYGYKRFILALGYQGEYIKRYFYDYRLISADFTLPAMCSAPGRQPRYLTRLLPSTALKGRT